MKTKEEKIKNISNYRLENYRQFIFCVSRKKEADMLAYIESQGRYTGVYYKVVIKKDMENLKKQLTCCYTRYIMNSERQRRSDLYEQEMVWKPG